MFFSLYSKLLFIPVTFQPMMLGGCGGLIESGEISIRRQIGFKIIQILAFCQTLFVFIRTLEYVKYGDGSGDLDWDIVPVMLIATVVYFIVHFNVYCIFDAGQDLTMKVYNEIIRLHGKPSHQKNHHVSISFS